MKKIRRNSKKGFTLVELIVVLVILAILAAMLVPALTGYIDRAKKEKDYQAASVVYAAAQAAITEAYGNGDISTKAAGTYASTGTTGGTSNLTLVGELAGIVTSGTNARLKEFSFSYDANLIITSGTVTLNDENGTAVVYELTASGAWQRQAATT